MSIEARYGLQHTATTNTTTTVTRAARVSSLNIKSQHKFKEESSAADKESKVYLYSRSALAWLILCRIEDRNVAKFAIS
jgi:hypothetical protein